MKPYLTIITLTITLAAGLAGHAAERASLHYEWGTEFDKVKKTLPADKPVIQFTPAEKPKYRNKIMSYITAIDSKLVDKMIILRVPARPMLDYLFVNGRLYTMTENWGAVDDAAEQGIRAQLIGKYGQPQLQQDKNLTILSFTSDNTKVLCYLAKKPNGRTHCRVYYYAKKLFRMLILE